MYGTTRGIRGMHEATKEKPKTAAGLLHHTSTSLTEQTSNLRDNHDKTLVRDPFPPLSSLIDYKVVNPKAIKSNVEFLMDFAIVGHPKCATTFTMEWLAQHEQVQMYTHELHALQTGNPAEFVQLMYELPHDHVTETIPRDGSVSSKQTTTVQYKRGYKAPRDIANSLALDTFADYWPNANLIIGLRHPVLWFESFYNFRLRHNYTLPPANATELFIGQCTKVHGVCTNEALFHHHLSLLGKTTMATPDELNLLTMPKDPFHPTQTPRPYKRPKHSVIPNKIFLYEISQLYSTNTTRADLYRQDLANFVGLQSPLPSIASMTKKSSSSSSSSKPRPAALNICESQYTVLREILIANGQAASKWIRTYFLPHPDVTVSSPDYFEELLQSWMYDPCDTRAGP